MDRRLFALVAMFGCTIGCSEAPAKKSTPISVTGKVSQAGQPVGNVTISFQPLDHGYAKSFPVKRDGAFQGELIAGAYAYFIDKSAPPPTPGAAPRKIDPKFYEANLERSVVVAPGQQLAIALD